MCEACFEIRSAELHGKTDSKFLIDAGFICARTAMAAILRTNIKDILCTWIGYPDKVTAQTH
jgi:hypothetical protein